jgi:hypothetical protein
VAADDAGALRLAAQAEVAADADALFHLARGFRAGEARARSRRVRLFRVDPGEGARIRWQVDAPLSALAGNRLLLRAVRGHRLRFALWLIAERPGRRLDFGFAGRHVAGHVTLDFAPLGTGRARVALTLEVRPLTRRAALAVGALRRLAPGLERRMAAALATRLAGAGRGGATQ